MIRAYTAIITGTGASEDAAAAIRDLPEVVEAHVITGDFDVMVEIEGETVLDLQKVITNEIHEIDGVGTTRTYIQLD